MAQQIFMPIQPDWYLDLFQPKTSIFSTHALISVHFKTVHYFCQPIFSLISHLKNTVHNLVIELCITLEIFQKYFIVIYQSHAQFFSYWIIDFLQKCKIPFLLLKRALSILAK